MKDFEVIIAGGGLAGLTAALHLAKKGSKVGVIEKGSFPHHKVCGEYLSREILPYFSQLQIPILDLGPRNIDRLLFSTKSGNDVAVPLPLGGLGISRYVLDNLLYELAIEAGVEVLQEKVLEIKREKEGFLVRTVQHQYTATTVFGAFGKRSVLDKNLERDFFNEPAPWVAVKTHYRNNDFPEDLVALHNFDGGYCGLSKTENDDINFCYLATYKSFKQHKNPEDFAKYVLRKNPHLDEFLSGASPVFDQPLSIAQISFSAKRSVDNHIMMLGDAAGLIHPLSGNGMAMAIHSAKLASEAFLKHRNTISGRSKMEAEYQQNWNKNFRRRMRTGRGLQKILLNNTLSHYSQKLISSMPFLLPEIIKQTHGKPV